MGSSFFAWPTLSKAGMFYFGKTDPRNAHPGLSTGCIHERRDVGSHRNVIYEVIFPNLSNFGGFNIFSVVCIKTYIYMQLLSITNIIYISWNDMISNLKMMFL